MGKYSRFRLCAILLSLAVLANGETLSLNAVSWTVFNQNKSIHVPATVPGGIYTDLHRARVISEPYYRYNDIAQRWVSRDNWTWTTSFEVPQELLTSENLNLVFHGIDTVSTVTLNGKEILKTDNMFIRYVVDVRGILSTKNVINVAIVSPLSYSLKKFEEYKANNYTVFPDGRQPSYRGDPHYNFIRKMQSAFSWDWGPSFPSLGIWKNIELEYYEADKLRDVVVGLQFKENNWLLSTKLYVEGNKGCQNTMVMIAIEELGLVFSQKLSCNKGEIVVPTLKIRSDLVERWWPNGLGEQKLYKFAVTVGSSTKIVKVGFRTIEIIQDKLDKGNTFYFLVNGHPLYSKGSNLIPIEVLQERVTSHKIRRLFQAAKDTNMNMLRVWGGGIYELDELYEAADETGILLWQDMMFACALYPTNKEFLDSVTEEVIQNVRRLQHHPSIALWSGNNENEIAVAYLEWKQMKPNRTVYENDYRTLYKSVIMDNIQKIDPWRPHVFSSPTNGIETEKSNYISRTPTSNIYGDIHHYDYNNDGWNVSIFPTARFVSEFGLQSFPSLQSWKQATDQPSIDLVYPLTDLVNHRQHHPIGNGNLVKKVIDKFNGPKRSLSAEDQFRVFCYLSQVYQAVAIKTEVEKFRKDRNVYNSTTGEGFNMGALYWQINDIWQAPTWASMEYDGRWKMLQNYAKHFFESILVSASLKPNSEELEISLIADNRTNLKTNLSIEVYNFDSFKPVRVMNKYTEIERTNCIGCSMHLHTIKTAQLFAAPCATTTCFLIVNLFDLSGTKLSQNWLIAAPPKQITSMVDADVKVTDVQGPEARPDGRNQFKVTVEAKAPAIFTWLETQKITGHFSDNGFLQHTPKKIVEFITYDTTVTKEQLAKELSIIEYSKVVDLPKA